MAHGRKDAGTIEGRILVEPRGAAADLRKVHADAGGVVVAAEERFVHRHARVEAEADEVAILQRGEHGAQEDVDVAIGVLRTPDHLVRDRVDRIVAAMARGSLVVRGVAEGQARIVVAQVGEAFAVVPDADLVSARERILLVRLHQSARSRIGELQFGDRQHAAVEREAQPIGIAQLRVAGVVRNRAAVEHAGENGDGTRHVRPRADAQRRERIRRAAAGQIRRRQHRPTEHGVEEITPVLADHEFVVEALLANLDVELVAKEFLLIPDFPKSGGAVGFDAARGLQGVKIARAQIPTVNLQGADIEQAAVQTEGALRVHLQRRGGEAVIGRALTDAAGCIAQDLAGFR